MATGWRMSNMANGRLAYVRGCIHIISQVTKDTDVPDSITPIWIEGGAHHLDLR